MTKQKTRELENIAIKAIRLIRPGILQNFTNRVERYYSAATKQEDLKEIPYLNHSLSPMVHER